jgi:hypothetical protein
MDFCGQVLKIENVISTWGGVAFHNFLVIGQLDGPLQKKIIKTFMLWDPPQLIKLIHMNHNKYLNSCKILGQKW